MVDFSGHFSAARGCRMFREFFQTGQGMTGVIANCLYAKYHGLWFREVLWNSLDAGTLLTGRGAVPLLVGLALCHKPPRMKKTAQRRRVKSQQFLMPSSSSMRHVMSGLSAVVQWAYVETCADQPAFRLENVASNLLDKQAPDPELSTCNLANRIV